MNRCDFKCVLKAINVQDRHRSTGRLFQHRGLATVKARSPMVERCVAGTRTSAVDAERSRRRELTSDSGWVSSDRYCGAAPFRQRCTRTGRSKHRRTPQDTTGHHRTPQDSLQDTAGHHRTAKDRHNIVIYEPHT